MTNPLKFIRPSVRAIKPYFMSEQTYRIKLNQNENPFDLPASLKQEILRSFETVAWNRYPSFTTDKLRRKIAEIEDVRPEMILMGNGSNELLQITCSIILEPGHNFVTVQPTFQLYEQIGHIFGANLIQLQMDEELNFPFGQIMALNRSQAIPLQIYCSPNNPTGSILTLNQIKAILEVAAGIVAIDEAYCDFSRIKATSLLQKYPNLVLTRTFSKALAMAGFRLGYLIAPEPLAREIYKAKLPYNVDAFSELTALAVLNQPSVVQDQVQRIIGQRDWLMQKLHALRGVKVYPTQSNFFLLRTPLSPKVLYRRLLDEAGILIRNVSANHPLLADKVRISVGTPEENQIFLQTLREILGER